MASTNSTFSKSYIDHVHQTSVRFINFSFALLFASIFKMNFKSKHTYRIKLETFNPFFSKKKKPSIINQCSNMCANCKMKRKIFTKKKKEKLYNSYRWNSVFSLMVKRKLKKKKNYWTMEMKSNNYYLKTIQHTRIQTLICFGGCEWFVTNKQSINRYDVKMIVCGTALYTFFNTFWGDIESFEIINAPISNVIQYPRKKKQILIVQKHINHSWIYSIKWRKKNIRNFDLPNK